MSGIPPLCLGRAAKRIKLPKALSVGEETFALHMNARGLNYRREYEFCLGRKWRFDFAFLDKRTIHGTLLAVEIDGGAHSGGRHTRGAGFEADLEKINAAIKLGWMVLRYTPSMVRRGIAEMQVAELLGVS